MLQKMGNGTSNISSSSPIRTSSTNDDALIFENPALVKDPIFWDTQGKKSVAECV